VRTEAEIVRVSPALNEQTRTLRVEASVEAEGTALRPGTFVLSTIGLGMVDDAMQLPRGAVYSTLGQDRVTVVDGQDQAQPRDVYLIGEADGFAYVRGVTASDRVVTQGGGSVAPGTTVKPVSAGARDTAATKTP
jgi:multidrug efflux system membrane fusion protein